MKITTVAVICHDDKAADALHGLYVLEGHGHSHASIIELVARDFNNDELPDDAPNSEWLKMWEEEYSDSYEIDITETETLRIG